MKFPCFFIHDDVSMFGQNNKKDENMQRYKTILQLANNTVEGATKLKILVKERTGLHFVLFLFLRNISAKNCGFRSCNFIYNKNDKL